MKNKEQKIKKLRHALLSGIQNNGPYLLLAALLGVTSVEAAYYILQSLVPFLGFQFSIPAMILAPIILTRLFIEHTVELAMLEKLRTLGFQVF